MIRARHHLFRIVMGAFLLSLPPVVCVCEDLPKEQNADTAQPAPPREADVLIKEEKKATATQKQDPLKGEAATLLVRTQEEEGGSQKSHNQAHGKAVAVNADADGLVFIPGPHEWLVKANFPFPTKLAVFHHSNALWIFIDASVEKPKLPPLKKGLIKDIQVYEKSGTTLVRLALAQKAYPKVTRIATRWGIQISKDPKFLAQKISPELEEEDGGQKSLKIPLKNLGTPQSYKLPIVEDELILIPSESPNQGIPYHGRYVDLDILPSVQGLVMRALNDTVNVTTDEESARVFVQNGFVASPALDLTQQRKKYKLTPFFHFESAHTHLSWVDANRSLIQEIADSPKQKRRKKRFDLALYLLATNHIREGIGALTWAEKDDPGVTELPVFHALRGLGHFLMGRFEKAVSDFSFEGLKGDPEMDLWRHIALMSQRPKTKSLAPFIRGLNFMRNYPADLKNNISFLAAHIEMELSPEKDFFMPIIDQKKLNRSQKHEYKYLNILKLLHQNKREEAVKELKKFGTKPGTEFAARGAFLLTQILRADKKISLDKEKERLETLRYRWRGDDLEFSILERLSEIYIEKKDYIHALRCLRQLTKYFDQHPQHKKISKMAMDTFVNAMDAQNQGSAFKTVALYDEFKQFAPKDERHDAIIHNMIDQLIQSDLLQRAGKLIESDMKGRNHNSEEKLKRTGQLALLKLLDNQPEKTLQLLDKIQARSKGKIEEKTAATHRLLRAQANIMLEKLDQARAAISGDTSKKADQLRIHIAFQKRDWLNASKDIAQYADKYWTEAEEVNPQIILNWAVALSMNQDTAGVDSLRSEYLSAVKDTPYAAAFELITSPSSERIAMQGDILTQIQESQKMGSLLEEFRTQVKKEGIDSVS